MKNNYIIIFSLFLTFSNANASINGQASQPGIPIDITVISERFLTDIGPHNVNQSESDGLTSLHFALLMGDERLANSLLDMGADPRLGLRENITLIRNERSFILPEGSGPLHIIAGSMSLFSEALIRKLVQKGALIDQENGNGATPLILASSRENLNVVRVLLDIGANPSKGNVKMDNATPIGFATVPTVQLQRAGQRVDWVKRTAIVDILLTKGASLIAYGNTSALHYLIYAITRQPELYADNELLPLIKRLTRAGKVADIQQLKTLVEQNRDKLSPQVVSMLEEYFPKRSYMPLLTGAVLVGAGFYCWLL